MDIELDREIDRRLPSIEAFARQFYAQLDFAHNEGHGERVVVNAKLIQKDEGGSRSAVIAGAWLHQFHDHLDLLSAGLAEIGISQAVQQSLKEIVAVCRPHKISNAASLEARIVFDADALDLIGPLGTVRELLCNFQHRRQSWMDAVENCQRVQGLFLDKLQTKSARLVAKDMIRVNAEFWSVYREEVERRT